jgi:hypothetical protein
MRGVDVIVGQRVQDVVKATEALSRTWTSRWRPPRSELLHQGAEPEQVDERDVPRLQAIGFELSCDQQVEKLVLRASGRSLLLLVVSYADESYLWITSGSNRRIADVGLRTKSA